MNRGATNNKQQTTMEAQMHSEEYYRHEEELRNVTQELVRLYEERATLVDAEAIEEIDLIIEEREEHKDNVMFRMEEEEATW